MLQGHLSPCSKQNSIAFAPQVSNIGDNEKVSAAILAKVLEERGKERSARFVHLLVLPLMSKCDQM